MFIHEEGGRRNVHSRGRRKEKCTFTRKEDTTVEDRTVISSKTVLLAHANVTNKAESETDDSMNVEDSRQEYSPSSFLLPPSSRMYIPHSTFHTNHSTTITIPIIIASAVRFTLTAFFMSSVVSGLSLSPM